MYLGDYIAARTKEIPDKSALRFRGEITTFAVLDRQINQVANGLIKLGLGKGDKVALLMVNSPQFIVSYFAITRIGGVVVPINVLLKGEEMAFILQDSQAKALMTMPLFGKLVDAVVPRIPSVKHVIMAGDFAGEGIIKFSDLLLNEPATPVGNEGSEEDVVVYIYTSGTTGRPKGAMLSHTNLAENVKSLHEILDTRTDDNFMCVLPMFHSFAWTVCVLMPLFAGASVVIMEQFIPNQFITTMLEEKVTVFCGVPAMYAVLNQIPPVDFPDLRLAVSGGAALPQKVLETFKERYNIEIVEGYGLSEASPACALNPIYGKKKANSIGVALPRVTVKIMDDKGNEVPRNTPGELCVQGPNVMVGYFNLPEATDEALKDGWLHTGDIAYMDEEGYIFIVDRKKDLIIVGGLNVYPREIEEVLYSNPKVAEAAVIGVQDDLRGETIKAFIALKKGEEATDKEFFKLCRERLANYKMPKFIEFIEELPKNATGKILKRELKA